MKRSTLLLFVFTMFFSVASLAQVKLGTDIYSHYVWRGAALHSAESFQPALTYTAGSLSVGAWGSYSAAGAGYAENDLWASYAFGPISVIATDYYIPSFLPATATFFDYNTKKGAGSHVIEVGASYTGGESLPISVAAYYDVIGGLLDPDNSSYVQVSYPFTIESTTLTASIGATPAKSSAWYVTTGAGVVSLGIMASKTIKISEDFSIPFNVQYVMNPYSEKSYLFFGISL
ncbi:MAG: hypothetical protein WCX28_14255 [Bacteriovoracaceae bacterium]|nr:hypothetical protein [Bacteroidota bacterium]